MEIKINASGHGDVNFEFSCTEQETAMLIQDPVYQALGMKLVNEISFKPQPKQQKQHSDHNTKKANGNQLNDRVDALRKVIETEHRRQARHNEVVVRSIDNLCGQVYKMRSSIVKDT